MTRDRPLCPKCGSASVELHGVGQIRCKKCNKWSRTGLSNVMQSNGEITTFTHRRIRSLQDLIEVCEIDINDWYIERWVCNKWEVGAKNASDEITIEPLFQVKAWLRRRVEEKTARDVAQSLVADMKQHAPKYPRIRYPKSNAFMYEIDFPDLHFGKMTWREESGQDYDIKLAAQIVNQALGELLGYSRIFKVERILIPFGNDFFNVDNKNDTTTAGTPQQEDTRWEKTFREGRRLAVSMVELCLSIAPVDVIVIPGNHDEQRAFYLGEALECWFHKAKNVSIDNRAMKRKYVQYGQNLIGFTHGAHEKVDKLPALMPVEQPGLWAKTRFREWHLGDKHHKKSLRFETEEVGGVVVRYLRSLSATDTWHFDKGFVGNLRAAEGYLWHKDHGLVAQFNAMER